MKLVRRHTNLDSLKSQHPEEREWPENIRAGSLSAFEAMFKAYYGDMVDFAAYHVHRVDVAEDLVQEIFLNLWKQKHEWQPKGSLRTYLFGAVRNHSLNYLRRKKIEWRWVESQIEPRSSSSPEDALIYDELNFSVRQAIDALPERRRIIFSLSRQQGLTYAEIAALLNISPKTVEHQISSALKFLGERLADCLILCIVLML